MAGILSVQQIQGLATAADPTTVTIPTGYKLVAEDTAGVYGPGSVVQVKNGAGTSVISISNSTSGRVYSDLVSISYTPISSSNKIVLIGTGGMTSHSNETSRGAFGVVFNVNGTVHEFSDYPWYDSGHISYPVYPPDTTITKTIDVPTGSAFDIKLRGYSYTEANTTMTVRFNKYSLTVMEIAA